MKTLRSRWGLGLLSVIAWPALGLADVQPHPLFADGAVLQRGMPVPVWGTGDDGEKVVVKFQGQEVATTAQDGKWMVKLAELKAGGPLTLTIEGKNKVEIVDVLVGEVWICSGQSNMEWPLSKTADADSAIANAGDEQLRFFTVPRGLSDVPMTTMKRPQKPGARAWLASDSESAPKFSAVGYYFGRDLRKALGVPVGLIHTSWGGTAAEAWTSRGVLESKPILKTVLDEYEKALARLPELTEKYEAARVEHRKKVAEAKAEGKEPPTAPRQPVGPGTPHPAAIYNAMVVPLQPFAIRGTIWYQGESNANRAFQYQTLFPAMIQNWRDDWKQGDFPFLFVQLAPYRKIIDEPVESDWAELREAQLQTTRALPATAMAVITDVGEEDSVHPVKKEPVGARLALAALGMVYKEPVIISGPIYAGEEHSGDRILLSFRYVGKGLVARGGPLTGFTIAGADRKFYKADATIEGDKIAVRSDQVPQPVAVRFGWWAYPVVNFWNADGLPASPFRTDHFPMTTEPKPSTPRAARAGVQP